MSFALARDGVRLHYHTAGNGPFPLLFMHGWAGSGGYFNEVVDAMDLSGVRVVTMDIRGHGRSDQAADGYDLDGLARDVLACADAAGAETFVLIGFSMSAKFAQFVARVASERVRGLVLIGGAPTGHIPFPLDLQRDWVSRAGDRERLRELIAQFIVRPVTSSVWERFLDDAVRVGAPALEQTLVSCVDTAFNLGPGTVAMPVLVVAGRRDPIFVPEALIVAIKASLSQARIVLLDCGHEIPMECPGDLAGLIEAFVAGLSAGNAAGRDRTGLLAGA